MLHVIYRSYGGENRKGRPEFYDKQLALGSMVRAFQKLVTPAELIYLNDGPIPADRLKIMQFTGEVISKAGLGNKGSISTALSLPAARGWDPDDLVWFAEDDYLYQPDSLNALMRAEKFYRVAEYFSLYALIGNRQPNGMPPEDSRVPARWKSDVPEYVGGETWRKALSTTSTFGARVRTIKADRAMMLAAMRCGGAFDHSTCLVYQGYIPYPFWFLMRDVRTAHGTTQFVRRLFYSLFRMGFNVYALARRATTPLRILVASDPSLATHLELDFLAREFNWAALAAETNAWISNCGWASSGMVDRLTPDLAVSSTALRHL